MKNRKLRDQQGKSYLITGLRIFVLSSGSLFNFKLNPLLSDESSPTRGPLTGTTMKIFHVLLGYLVVQVIAPFKQADFASIVGMPRVGHDDDDSNVLQQRSNALMKRNLANLWKHPKITALRP